jgi:hypothetical protein
VKKKGPISVASGVDAPYIPQFSMCFAGVITLVPPVLELQDKGGNVSRSHRVSSGENSTGGHSPGDKTEMEFSVVPGIHLVDLEALAPAAAVPWLGRSSSIGSLGQVLDCDNSNCCS